MHKAYKPNEAPENYDYEETCPDCEASIPILIDDNCNHQYKVTCPVCGKPMMLCGQCMWDGRCYCDWSRETGCYRDR